MLMAFIVKGLLLSGGERTIMQGLVERGDNFVLVCPIDSEAPAGRLILPQVMAIRDILDNNGTATVLQPEQLEGYLKSVLPCGLFQDNQSANGSVEGKLPIKMVVTDSQAFRQVAQIVPQQVPLTSFSVLMARAKGSFQEYIKGVNEIDTLKDGDKVLVLESCTHHTSCDDIGRVKIPAMLQKKCGCKLQFTFISGLDELPPLEELQTYSLVLQCGGCMVTRRQLSNRIRRVISAGVPVTNYGMCIAYVTGIFHRATALF